LASSTGHPILSLTGHQSCRGTGDLFQIIPEMTGKL